MDAALGDDILFLDTDDILLPGALSELKQVIRNQKEVQVLIGKWRGHNNNKSNDALLSGGFCGLA